MSTAERISEVEREALAGEVQQRGADAEFVLTGAKQAGACQYIEQAPRAHAARLEIHELAAWSIHQLVDLILVDFERRAAFVSPAERQPEAAARVIVTRAERGHVTLIVIGNESRAVGNLDHLVFEEKPSRYRAEIDHARIRVAQVARRAASSRQIDPHIHTVSFAARDRVRHDD